MTDPTGDKDRPAADPALSYDPPPTAEPAPYTPENYDPPASDSTVAGPPEPVAPTPELPPGAFETPAAYIPGTPYAPPGQPIPPAYQQPPYPPAYGQPYATPAPYGQPTPYGQPYAAPRAQDNALAIGALVCSILGFCSGITAIAGLIMGHIALSKSNRGEAGGRGLATAAVIVGYVVVALGVGFFTTLIILGTNGYLN